ncbi:uncharacterized protein LOC101861172 [Aplysia californica]|uniref:Uncharacterized protein LOC101861172 n=1 Tax=Aplysia californica TaxID=6500 RepID=A0ABM1ADA5_APLCA|nr:uncharacterized protein LOC101861172 [Aplysia californica]
MGGNHGLTDYEFDFQVTALGQEVSVAFFMELSRLPAHTQGEALVHCVVVMVIAVLIYEVMARGLSSTICRGDNGGREGELCGYKPQQKDLRSSKSDETITLQDKKSKGVYATESAPTLRMKSLTGPHSEGHKCAGQTEKLPTRAHTDSLEQSGNVTLTLSTSGQIPSSRDLHIPLGQPGRLTESCRDQIPSSRDLHIPLGQPGRLTESCRDQVASKSKRYPDLDSGFSTDNRKTQELDCKFEHYGEAGTRETTQTMARLGCHVTEPCVITCPDVGTGGMEQIPSIHQQHRSNNHDASSSLNQSHRRLLLKSKPDSHISSSDWSSSCKRHAPSSHRPIRRKIRPRVLAAFLFATLVLVAVAVGVARIRTRPTVHVYFPASAQMIRKVRMFSDFPDLSELSRNHSSLSLVSRLQLLDTQGCGGDRRNCQISVVCDPSTGQSVNCRCRTGFYFRHWKCHACSSRCPDDHYLVSACSVDTDAICKPCTVCFGSQYEAAQCTTTRDTICVDVSFPVGILPMNKSHLPDDGVPISVSHSPNVFLERLVDMEALETPMYVTNNQQSLDFVWPRLSGLDIAVSVSGVFLVPDYRDLDAVDDTKLFNRMSEPSQHTKDYYNFVQNYYCRHPVPDYYLMQLEIMQNRSSKARVIRCDSQDPDLTRCPEHYKDGDRFLDWDINSPCTAAPLPGSSRTASNPLNDGPNAVVCTEETDLLRDVFGRARPTTQEWMFPSRDCVRYKNKCDRCLTTAQCASPGNRSAEQGECCGIPCFEKDFCQKAYSKACPEAQVECATGEVDIFSLFPVFDTMDRQFACHLRYTPPARLYNISYSIRVPSIDFNMSAQNFSVTARSTREHERRLSTFDFIHAQHDTRLKIEPEVMLLGDHMELMRHHDSLMKPYTIRRLKSARQMSKQKVFNRDSRYHSAYVQFERPFLYSSFSWYRNGCHKNMSQIYPNQTLYEDDLTPVTARKNLVSTPDSPGTAHPGFTYQLYHLDREPYVKFFVKRGQSVLQHLQGRVVTGVLDPSSLFGQVTWHHSTQTWNIVFAGRQVSCPTVISIKIFTQLMTGCAGHFDVLINCPVDFAVTFNLSTGTSDLPDIFTLQVNDSRASHHLVVTSVYSPLNVDELTSGNTAQMRHKQSTEDDHKTNFNVIWIPVLLILAVTIIFLLVIFMCHTCMNKKAKKMAFSNKGRAGDEVVALNNQGEKTSPSVAPTAQDAPKRRWFINVFIALYVVYCLLFTCTLTFGVLYLAHSSVWSDISSPQNLGRELQEHVNKSLTDIQKFELKERQRIFKAFEKRREACLYHLESENYRLLRDYEDTTLKQIGSIFVENGTLHKLSSRIQKANVSVYMQQIDQFVEDCNKTIQSIVHRFQANYFQFLRSTTLNDWLLMPRQIFLVQDGESPDRRFLSNNQVKQFASWLEIDKTEELLAVQENVFGRLNSIKPPKVSSLDVTFPSAVPYMFPKPPVFDFHSHSFAFHVLDPSTNDSTANSSADPPEDPPGAWSRNKRDAGDGTGFGISGALARNPSSNFSDSAESQEDSKSSSPKEDPPKSYLNNDARYKTETKVDENHPRSSSNSDEARIDDFDFKTLHDEPRADSSESNVILDAPGQPKSAALSSSDETGGAGSENSNDDDGGGEDDGSNSRLLFVLIGVFLTLDVVLWIYRFFWLTTQLYATRHGYADRIPTDDACKQVLEIQTAYHLPAFEDPHDDTSGFYVDGKEQLYVSDRETSAEITFLQIPKAKDKDDILQKIWNEKMNASDHRTAVRMRRCFLVRWFQDLWRLAQQLLMSQLVWQACVTFLAILFICLFVYCVEFWLTADNFRTLVGGQSAAADVQWHLDSSGRYLHGLAQQLTSELSRVKAMCDAEVEALTDVFFSTVNMQTTAFTATLRRLCNEAKGRNCDTLKVHEATGGRIVGCNFLPLQAETFHDLSLSHMEAVVAREVTPLLQSSRHMLSLAFSFVVFLLCFRLLCQAGATTARHYLLLTGRLPRVRVYQAEEQTQTLNRSGVHRHVMQRSQSWVDSCESGVYVGEGEDSAANKLEESNVR